MRVFVDANILFSAANPSSSLRRLLGDIRGKGTLITSRLAADEARRNLMLKRPQWKDEFETLLRHFQMVPSAVLQPDIPLAEKDRPLLGAAIRASCTHFLTGDRRDFGSLFGRSIHGLKVTPPLDLARELDDG